MIDFFLNIIYPNVCGMCDRINKESLCGKCKYKLKQLEKNIITDYRNDKNKYFDYHAYLFKYEGIIREKLIDYKFNDKSYLYKTFSKIIIKNEKIYRFIQKYDIILPVPINKEREFIRGYNQTLLILKELKKENININEKILKKTKNNLPQSSLTKNQRILNVKDVYKLINEEQIKNKKILIFDDIYTTGSTVNECSKILKKAGAKEIGVLTIAKD